MYRFIKISIVLLIFVLFLTGCGQTKRRDEPSREEDIEESKQESGTNEDKPEASRVPSYFSNLEDFYHYVATGSRDNKDYKDVVVNIDRCPSVKPEALIKLDQLLHTEEDAPFIGDFKRILLAHGVNEYGYDFESGECIAVHYDPKYADDASNALVPIKAYTYVTEDQERFSLSDAKENMVYISEVNGFTIHRYALVSGGKIYAYCFDTVIDSFHIYITISKDCRESFPNSFMSAFFDDDKVSDAMRDLKESIATRSAK